MKKETVFLVSFVFIFLIVATTFISSTGKDINGDSVVNRTDIALLASVYRSSNATFDQNNDSVVDLFDLVVVSKNVSNTSVGGGVSNFTPNEPSGMTLLDEVSYNSTGHISVGSSNSSSNYNGSSLSPPYTPDAVARFVYPVGHTAGSVGERGVTLPDNTVRVYVSYNVYVSNNFVWHTSEVKQWYLFFVTDESQGSNWLGIRPTGAVGSSPGDYTLEGQTSPSGLLRDSHADNNAPSTININRSNWYHVEILYVMNTAGSSDGKFKMWIDENLSLDFDNVQYQSSPATQWKRIKLFPFFGGAPGSALTEEQYLYVDHSYISSSTSRS